VYAVHGILVSVSSGWTEFLTMSDLMFGAFGPFGPVDESLSLTVDLRLRGWFESPPVGIEREGAEERLGTNEFQEGEAARYAAGKLVVRYTDGREASARASYVLDRASRLRRILFREQPWDDQFALFRLAAQEPVLLKLERKGAVLLHGSAVAKDGRAVLFLGLNGSGKSTLCASLLDQLDYLSDNFLALDGTKALGFPSALRIPGPLAEGSQGLPTAHGKSLVRVDPGKTQVVAEAHALVFLSLGNTTSFTSLSPADGVRRLMQNQDMTHEFPRHTYLGSLAPPPNLEGLKALARDVPSYRLVMSRTAEAREHVLSLL